MNYQPAKNFASKSTTTERDRMQTTLLRLHATLETIGSDVDLARARSMVESLIDMTRANDEAVARTTGPFGLSGRKEIILKVLLRNAGSICTKKELARACGVCASSTGVIKVYVCQVRAELAEHGISDAIHNVWGVGYQIGAQDARHIQSLMHDGDDTDAAPATDHDVGRARSHN